MDGGAGLPQRDEREALMKFAYVLPEPGSYHDWAEFESDLSCVKEAGYDAVELQIADPAGFDEDRVRQTLAEANLPMCAFQTGGSYATHGNCLSTADDTVRERTENLLMSFVDLAERWKAVIVFGSLQGRLTDEPDCAAGEARILRAMRKAGQYAATRDVTIAFEPVNQLEVGFHNTIAAVAHRVRELAIPSVRMMVDTFHMNIEEKDMDTPLDGIGDILAHVHLSETNRDVLGTGHWNTDAFLSRLRQIGYSGYCSVGVYQTALSRHDCIRRSMQALRKESSA